MLREFNELKQASLLKQACDANRLSVSVAESVTVGHLQSIMAAVPGASTFFQGGITAYHIDQKTHVLGINRAHAEQVNCVSAQVAAEMALGVCRLFDTPIGIATTGYAEPPGLSNTTGAYAFYAIWDSRVSSTDAVCSGELNSIRADRVGNQHLFAEIALNKLVQYLTSE